MINIETKHDINWQNLCYTAYGDKPVTISPGLLQSVDQGRLQFLKLIEDGHSCYGVTTGLGQLIGVEFSESEKLDLSKTILRARAAAIGKAVPKPVARAAMFIRLVNFLSALDGVSAKLCSFIIERLNDDFTPWIPEIGHGMAGDAIAHTHCFQTLVGEGFVLDKDGSKLSAHTALKQRRIKPYELATKEGAALLNGIAFTPAYALHAHRETTHTLQLATLVAAATIEAIAAPKDSVDNQLKSLTSEAGTQTTITILNQYLKASDIKPYKLQSPISVRVIPQVHGALTDALEALALRIDHCLRDFTDNPVMVLEDGRGRFISNGGFHNQHLVNQVEHVAIALSHVGALSERRLHRLLDPVQTGLTKQLANRPGLDAGLVVAHKATVDIVARLRMTAQPLSLLTSETSAGQEDYMSLAVPCIQRIFELCTLARMLLAYELMTATVALDQRVESASATVRRLHKLIRQQVAPLQQDRPPGPDAETIFEMMSLPIFDHLLATINPNRWP